MSRKYAKEIQTPEYGWGLDGVVQGRADRLIGILNGVDYSHWSPEADRFIAQNYSLHNLEGKKTCKQDLLQVFGLPEENIERPVIGIVSRFVSQKGFDLIAAVADELMQEDLALVALGAGEAQYESLFATLAARYSGRVAVKIGYDNAVAHKIEAGADMFLMPSRYEPSGLNQMYSLRYGTPPIVRATGGLDDSVQNFDPTTRQGTGFKFEEYNGPALLACVRTALQTFRDPDSRRALQLNGMAKDFSWRASAASYATLYEAAKRSRIPRVARTSNYR